MAEAVRDAAGALVGYEGSLKDVSKRKQFERQIQANEEKFLAFFESAPDAIVIADRQGRIHLVNRQTEQLFGYARLELLGLPIETLMPRRYRPGHHEALRAEQSSLLAIGEKQVNRMLMPVGCVKQGARRLQKCNDAAAGVTGTRCSGSRIVMGDQQQRTPGGG